MSKRVLVIDIEFEESVDNDVNPPQVIEANMGFIDKAVKRAIVNELDRHRAVSYSTIKINGFPFSK